MDIELGPVYFHLLHVVSSSQCSPPLVSPNGQIAAKAKAQSGGKVTAAPSPVGSRTAASGKKKGGIGSEVWNRLLAVPRIVFEVRVTFLWMVRFPVFLCCTVFCCIELRCVVLCCTPCCHSRVLRGKHRFCRSFIL